MKHKKLFVTAIVVFSIVVFLAIFITLWFWGDSYPDFNGGDFDTVKMQSGKALDIPGLDDGAVPQGITNYTYTGDNEDIEKQEYFFISAYMKKGPSRIYVTSRSGYIGYVTLKNENGTDYYGHAGGIATNCNSTDTNGNKSRVTYGTLWVVSDGTVYCAKASAEFLKDNKNKNIADEILFKAKVNKGDKSIQFTSSFNAYNGASFCYYYDEPGSTTYDRLYVGEFYRKGDDRYSTAKNHHVTTLSGNKQYAFVNEYQTNTTSSNIYGITTLSDSCIKVTDENGNEEYQETAIPKIQKIISIPEKIQGFARTASGQLVLSQSYGLPNSHLYYYDWREVAKETSTNRTYYSKLADSNFEYEGVYRWKTKVNYTDSTLYVYFADASRAKRDYSVPAMAEGMCVNGDKIYLLFESGCYKYKAFVRQQIRDIYFFTPREK